MLACDIGPAPGPSLDDRVFLSDEVTASGAPQPLVAGTRLRLQFHEAPRFSASAGCNTLGGNYSLDGDVFVISDAGQTEIGCDSELHAQDDWYFEFLGSSPTLVLDGDALVLEGGDMRIDYLDQEVATPDVELVGPTWTVETIIEGEVASASDWASPATLVFGSDGTVTIDTGCNEGASSYTVSNGEITFSGASIGLIACEEDIMRLENAVLAVLNGPQPVTWQITVDRLSLRGPDAGLDLRASDG